MESILNVRYLSVISHRFLYLKTLHCTLSIIFYFVINCQAQFNITRISAIDSLNDEAWIFYQKGDITSFKSLGENALILSNETNYLYGKCESYQIIGTYHKYVGELDSADIWYMEALEAREELGDSLMISATLNNLAALSTDRGNYINALKRYENASQFIPKGKIRRRARLQSNLGVVHKLLGDYDAALLNIHQAKQLLKESMDSLSLAMCLMNEGNLNELMGELKQAKDNHNTALEIFRLKRDYFNQAKALNNLGNINLKNSEFKEALSKFESSLELFKRHNSVLEIAGVEQNISTTNRSMGNLEEAQIFLNRSLHKWDQLDNQEKKAEGLILLSEIFFDQKRYRQAIDVSKQAEDILPSSSISHYKLLNNLSLYYSSIGEFDKAYEYQKWSSSLQDSINTERQKWSRMEHDYRVQEKEVEYLNKENLLLFEKERKEKLLRYAILIGSGLIILICYIFYNNMLIRRQRKLALQQNLIKHQEIEKLLKDQELSAIRHILDIQEKERVRIAKDLHDRLGSMLSMVKLHFQNTNQKIDELKSANLKAYNKANSLLDEACGEVRKIAHNLSSGILKNFGLVAAIEELKSSLENTGQYSVEFVTHRINQRFDPKLEVALYRIIQELISNIIKHAEASEISIQLLRKNSELHLEVSDNGSGFSNLNEVYKKGMGLKNIESRLQTFEGKMRIDTRPKHGAIVFINIPLS